jgi:hypothetical protein
VKLLASYDGSNKKAKKERKAPLPNLKIGIDLSCGSSARITKIYKT